MQTDGKEVGAEHADKKQPEIRRTREGIDGARRLHLRNLQAALPLLRTASTKGDPIARIWLAFCMSLGWGCAKDKRKAARLVRHVPPLVEQVGRETGDLEMLTVAGLGYDVLGNYPKRQELLTLAASHDYAPAQFHLGLCLEIGVWDSPKDPQKALELFRRAVNQNYGPAQNVLAVAFAKGEGVTKDRRRACALYTLAVQNEDAEAMYNLGLCFLKGEGVDVDRDRGKALLLRAADNGYAGAQYAIGAFYKNGRYWGRNEGQAVVFFLRAANQKHIKGMYNLALCYEQGVGGLRKDAVRAKRLFREAANAGHELAHAALARYRWWRTCCGCCGLEVE